MLFVAILRQLRCFFFPHTQYTDWNLRYEDVNAAIQVTTTAAVGEETQTNFQLYCKE